MLLGGFIFFSARLDPILTNWVAQLLTCPVLETTIMLRAPPPRILPPSQPADLGHYCNPAKDLVIANIFDGAVVGGTPRDLDGMPLSLAGVQEQGLREAWWMSLDTIFVDEVVTPLFLP